MEIARKGGMDLVDVIAPTNIDDICREARRQGIREVEVDEFEMLTAAYFVGANCGNTEYGSQAIKTGKVEMLMGVKLIEI